MEFNLKKILLALLMSTSEPLSIKDIQAVITRYHAEAGQRSAAGDESDDEPTEKQALVTRDGQEVMQDLIDQVPSLLTATQIREAMDALAAEAEEAGAVYRILQSPAGYRLATARAYADWVRLLRDEPRPARLSQAALETLAIISYRQPVTRAEMEAIRGVSVDSALNRLQEKELIRVIGRADLPGRPIQYGTTEQFLEFVGVRSLDELPASDVLSPGQLNEWIQRATNPEEYSDKDVGLQEDDAPEKIAETEN